MTQKEADLASHPVVGLVLQVRDVEKLRFRMHLVSKVWILFFRVSKQGPCFTAIEENGDGKRFVALALACKAYGVTPPDSV